jgi:pyruvyltransferase
MNIGAGDISMFWWDDRKHGANFGDAVSPMIVKALSGKRIHKVREAGVPRLLACGSIIKWARPGDSIWGTGHASISHETAHGVQVHAVRGPITRASLQAHAVPCPPVYGDPAILLPFLYGPRTAKRRYKLGVVPHYVDHLHAESVLRNIMKSEDVLMIDVQSGPANVIDSICSCEVIASSSLHGIIAAEAYGIPSVWVEFGDGISGGGMKFRDYYLGLRDEFLTPVDWRKVANSSQAFESASLPDAGRMASAQRGLVDSAPFHIESSRFDSKREDDGWVYE